MGQRPREIFSAALWAGDRAAQAMWTRTREGRATGPNVAQLHEDARRLHEWQHWLIRARVHPAIVDHATPFCGAWQLMFIVHNFAPALQKVIVEARQPDGAWTELGARFTIEWAGRIVRVLLEELPEAFRQLGCDGCVMDQVCYGTESVADAMGIPLIVACALFMENMDSTVLTTALPSIARDLGESPLALKLALTAYLVSLAVFIPISGWVADRFGARTVMYWTFIGSVICCFFLSYPATRYIVTEANAAKVRAILDSGKLPKIKSPSSTPVRRDYPAFMPGMSTSDYVHLFNRQFDGQQVKIQHDCPRYHMPAPMLDATEPDTANFPSGVTYTLCMRPLSGRVLASFIARVSMKSSPPLSSAMQTMTRPPSFDTAMLLTRWNSAPCPRHCRLNAPVAASNTTTR